MLALLVIPIEVKSGWVTQVKSLKVFSDKYLPPYSVVFSARNLRLDSQTNRHNYPLYLASKFPLLWKDGTTEVTENTEAALLKNFDKIIIGQNDFCSTEKIRDGKGNVGLALWAKSDGRSPSCELHLVLLSVLTLSLNP